MARVPCKFTPREATLSALGSEISLGSASDNRAEEPIYVFLDGGSDMGGIAQVYIPDDYDGTTAPKIVARGVLDGAPGASDVLGFVARVKSTDIGESADQAGGGNKLGNKTIGSNGEGWGNEHEVEITIDLLTSDIAAGEWVNFSFKLDISVTTYGGLFLLFEGGLMIEYTAS